MSTTSGKPTRLNIRVSEHEKDVIARAAEALQRSHKCEDFDCGSYALNGYLSRVAWTSQQSGAARTYVTSRGKRVIG